MGAVTGDEHTTIVALAPLTAFCLCAVIRAPAPIAPIAAFVFSACCAVIVSIAIP